jgi:hypothetical protein
MLRQITTHTILSLSNIQSHTLRPTLLLYRGLSDTLRAKSAIGLPFHNVQANGCSVENQGKAKGGI